MHIPKSEKIAQHLFDTMYDAIMQVREMDWLDFQVQFRRLNQITLSKVLLPLFKSHIEEYAQNAHAIIREIADTSDYPINDVHMKIKMEKFLRGLDVLLYELNINSGVKNRQTANTVDIVLKRMGEILENGEDATIQNVEIKGLLEQITKIKNK